MHFIVCEVIFSMQEKESTLTREHNEKLSAEVCAI